MKKRRTREHRIFFPWEIRGRGLLAWLALGRMRPVVLALTAVVVVVAIATSERRRAGVRQTRATLIDVRRAVDRYIADHDGGCPPDLGAAVEYAHVDTTPRDAWGGTFRLICPSSHKDQAYELMSDGPDGKPGGLDRIQ
jgi:hypothetical protein